MTTYLTTAIPYVNAAPHLGHALELVQADVLARHRRLRGEPVRLLTGTDDHALKNVAAARAAGREVRAFVEANAGRFTALWQPLELSFDDFLRTSADPRHAPGVRGLWSRCLMIFICAATRAATAPVVRSSGAPPTAAVPSTRVRSSRSPSATGSSASPAIKIKFWRSSRPAAYA